MKIIVDSSEQAPWFFGPGIPTVKRSLDTGDYSVESYESVLTVERKSLNDLVKTVIHDWLRFSKQLRRMAAMDVAIIVVDSTVDALMTHLYDSDALPQSVRGKLNAIFVDYGVPTVFIDNRDYAAAWVLNLFEMYVQKREGKR